MKAKLILIETSLYALVKSILLVTRNIYILHIQESIYFKTAQLPILPVVF